MVKTKRSDFHIQFHPEGRALIDPLTAPSRVCGMTIQRHPCFYRERTHQGRAKSGVKDEVLWIVIVLFSFIRAKYAIFKIYPHSGGCPPFGKLVPGRGEKGQKGSKAMVRALLDTAGAYGHFCPAIADSAALFKGLNPAFGQNTTNTMTNGHDRKRPQQTMNGLFSSKRLRPFI